MSFEESSTCLAQQVCCLYDREGVDIKTIAEELELEEEAVKVILLQNSRVYNSQMRKGELTEENDISKEEYKEFLDMYKDMARVCPNEFVKERMLRHLMQEHKGRNDPKHLIKTDRSLNIGQLNVMIVQAREKAKSISEATKTPIIENTK